MLKEKLNRLVEGSSSVAESVFGFDSEFGEGLIVTFRDEEWVVAEALPAPLLLEQTAFHRTAEVALLAAITGEHHGATETAGADFAVLHFFH